MDERKEYEEKPSRTAEDEQKRSFSSDETVQYREELPFHIPRD